MVVPFVNITCTWGNGEIMMEKALIYSLIGLFWVCTWFTGCSTKLEGMLTVVEIKKVMPEFDTENETEEVEKSHKKVNCQMRTIKKQKRLTVPNHKKIAVQYQRLSQLYRLRLLRQQARQRKVRVRQHRPKHQKHSRRQRLIHTLGCQ